MECYGDPLKGQKPINAYGMLWRPVESSEANIAKERN
jgi:hypothetical protein